MVFFLPEANFLRLFCTRPELPLLSSFYLCRLAFLLKGRLLLHRTLFFKINEQIKGVHVEVVGVLQKYQL